MMADLDGLGRFTSYFYEIAKFVLETNYFQDELLYSQGKKGDKNSPYLIELIAKHKSFYLLSENFIFDFQNKNKFYLSNEEAAMVNTAKKYFKHIYLALLFAIVLFTLFSLSNKIYSR